MVSPPSSKPSLLFAYGSLADRETAVGTPLGEATIAGWARAWAHRLTTPATGACALGLVRASDAQTLGLVLELTPDQLQALCVRETGYALERVRVQCHFGERGPQSAQTFVGRPEHRGAPGSAFPILQSYLDAVLAGCARRRGPDGVDRFLETTAGWGPFIVDDRQRPLYPRAKTLSEREIEIIDTALRRRGFVPWTRGP